MFLLPAHGQSPEWCYSIAKAVFCYCALWTQRMGKPGG